MTNANRALDSLTNAIDEVARERYVDRLVDMINRVKGVSDNCNYDFPCDGTIPEDVDLLITTANHLLEDAEASLRQALSVLQKGS